MKLFATFLLFSAACLGVAAQEPHQTPTRADFVLLMADAGVRANDVMSTRYALNHGWVEKRLPNAIASHTPAMAAYSAGVVAADWWMMRFLERHNHKRIAYVFMVVEIGQDAQPGLNNWRAHKP
jgi:adenosylmethionine-8-amino-7-oxononanoate aminotransferase